MKKGIEKLLESPFKTGWLKKGEKILVKYNPVFSIQLGHDAPPARTKQEAIKKEVREYLLSGNVCRSYSTTIWFEEEPCNIKVRVYKVSISKTKGIRVKYKIGK